MSVPLPPAIGLFGFGAFARLVAKALAPYLPLVVHDPSGPARSAARQMGLPTASLEEAARCDILILAVPLSALGTCLAELSGHLRPGQIVIDVCSVKQEPARLMQALLPPGVDLLATHPMFGPQSAGDDVAGHRIVLCPLRGRQWRRVAAFLRRKLGLEIIVTSPEEHDRQAAMSQGLTHMLARAFESFGAVPTIRTPSFDLLMRALSMVRGDSPEVYDAIIGGNPHVGPMRDRLVDALRTGQPSDGPGTTPSPRMPLPVQA
ncbi:prephenate dehydrogenase [Ancylobacter oerskovii]|uniref:Prephenate dehydrogenase/arogenate dehydrogenase family protein n=1 Tax=Ancylobacter oerskovii TaxID=459519 RepID=A0ABW4YZD4_9HYPH|nr:prephenate dehydrogenase [Ancylobacter oerskovii]MBS7543945.1 prephenate dehydrogenase [Ancylobacter oerskovii]